MTTPRTNPRPRLLTLTLCGVALACVALPLVAGAAGEGSQKERPAERAAAERSEERGKERSTERPTTRPRPRLGLGGGAGAAGGFGGGAGIAGLGEGELRELIQFVVQNMPNTVGALRDRKIDPNESQQEIVRSLIANRDKVEKRRWLAAAALFQFRRYNRGRHDFPELSTQYLQDIKDTDDMVGLLVEYRQADPAKRESLKTEIRSKLQSVARSMLDERRRRIEKLRASLDKEESQLAHDESKFDESIDKRLSEMIERTLAAPPPTSPSQTPTASTQPAN